MQSLPDPDCRKTPEHPKLLNASTTQGTGLLFRLLKNHIHLILLLLVCLGLGGKFLWDLEYNTGYTPDQPIPFSHKLHAGDYKMDCLYCHASAEKGPHATIPPMNVCMGCHSVIAVTKDNIKKMTQMYNDGEVMPWVRVHRLPDHVYFNHKWHLNAGVTCQECHGPVETMAVVGQFKRLEMGDCLACHRKRDRSDAWLALQDSLGTGVYPVTEYKSYPYLKYIGRATLWSAESAGELPAVKAAPAKSATGVFPEQNAMTQCSTCHQ